MFLVNLFEGNVRLFIVLMLKKNYRCSTTQKK